MMLSRIFSFFVFSVTLSSLTLAAPAPAKPDLAAVQGVVANLKSSTDGIVPELRNLVATNNVTQASVAPLMNQLISAVNTARFSLNSIPLSAPDGLEKRQDVSDIATIIAEIIADISAVLESLIASTSAVPILGILIPELDVALTTLIAGLVGLVSGLTAVLGGLLSSVSGIVGGVGLGLLLGILGLAGI